MTLPCYLESDIDKNETHGSSETGHTVFLDAKIREKSIVYKLNKRGKPQLSNFEVAFSGLAELFIEPNLTPPQVLVTNEAGDVTGVASDHLVYSVQKREGEGSLYTAIDDAADASSILTDSPTVYFFNKKPAGFFSSLVNNANLTIDMDSLASVLTSSYTLEEDDLHKGNLAFYVVQKAHGPHVVFMKIDHDMMMSDSVMSYYSSRLLNWRHGQHAFEVTARDLIEFPKLHDSDNYYWPTSERYFTQLSGAKVYDNDADMDAFISLGRDKESEYSKQFQRAKWRHFYKHILIPTELIQKAVANGYDENKPAHKAQVTMITQAVVARQARLRAVLFSIPEFREFVMSMDDNEHRQLVDEVLYKAKEDNKLTLKEGVEDECDKHRALCDNGFVEGDTPLHVAIKLGDYRYDETWKSFSHFAEEKNFGNPPQKPLDVAISLNLNISSPGSNKNKIIKHLLAEGVDKTKSFNNLPKHQRNSYKNYRHKTIHVNHVLDAKTPEEFINAFRDISEDHQFTLKMKKKLSIDCMKHYLAENKNNTNIKPILEAFKNALEDSPKLQFIRQFRSRLWIVRRLRGLFGGTETQMVLDDLVSAAIKERTPSRYFCSFFCAPRLADREPPPEPAVIPTN